MKALLLAVACAVFLVCDALANGGGGPGLIAIALYCAPLALLGRIHPLAVLGSMCAFVFVALEAAPEVKMVAVPAGVAAFALAKSTDRRTTIIASAALVPVALVAIWGWSPHGLWNLETVKSLGLLMLPLAFGNAVRDHKAFQRALVERAETAERTREEEALRRVGEERLRLARELHDVVAHSMVAINVQAGVAAHLIDRRPEQAREALTEIKRVSGEALTDLRTTLGMLRAGAGEAVPLRPSGGLSSLDELCDGVRTAGLAVDVSVRGDVASLPTALDGAAYRIVQEALTNVLRHARATTARVSVDAGAGDVRVVVDDDGVGARSVTRAQRNPENTLPAEGSGNGLRGMRERAAAVGGTLSAGPREGVGWRVEAVLPRPAPVPEPAAAPATRFC